LKREETKARLIDAAETWFSQRGYDQVSVSEIAATAGVVPSLINTYFQGKAGLLYAVVQKHNAPQYQAIREAASGPGSAFDRLDRLIAVCCEMDLRQPRLYAALQALSWTWPPETEVQNIKDLRPFYEACARILEDGIAAGTMRAMPPEDAARIIYAAQVMGLRPALFFGVSAGECAAQISVRIRGLLAKPP
jgi:AcrR family transcriptional regulator